MKGPFRFLLLSIFSALLLSAAWFAHLGILIFFAFIPLLILEDEIRRDEKARSKLRLFGYSYITFLLWNVLVTWWVVYASFGGACMAFIFNSLLMSIVFVLYSNIKFRIGFKLGPWLLIPCWLAWEHIHTLWDITWTWLTLGNVFAFHHNWIQWYEFTGTSGGTLWVLSANILGFLAVKKAGRALRGSVLKLAGCIILPVLFSYMVYYFRMREADPAKKTEVAVVQPNIDPYSEKFYMDYQSQFLKALRLVRGKISDSTGYLVLPETFITGIDDELNEETINQYLEISWFRDSLMAHYPQLEIVTGANTYKFYHSDKDRTITSRQHRGNGLFYDVFNTAVYIDNYTTEVYHKSKLVPGVERMPFPALLKPLENMAIDMGGTVGSLGTQPERTVFKSKSKDITVAPVICYESVYADYVAEYIRKKASVIFIITNDGWWDDTPGYVQHLNYARLRAIENRREIARSANTGVSCFIDRLGNIYQPTSWWKEAVIKRTVNIYEDLTFFSRYGDLLSYASVIIAVVLLVWSNIVRFKGKIAGESAKTGS